MSDVELLRVWLYAIGCVVIAVTMFCRAVHMDRHRAVLPIRIAVTCGGSAAVWCLYSLTDGHVPSWPDLAMVAAWGVMLVTTSRLWEYGLPNEFEQSIQFDEAPQ
jgi:peptidoglycan/LPS O-acetylase OafA/YrhL